MTSQISSSSMNTGATQVYTLIIHAQVTWMCIYVWSNPQGCCFVVTAFNILCMSDYSLCFPLSPLPLPHTPPSPSPLPLSHPSPLFPPLPPLSDGLVVCHLPYGPTASFSLSNTVMRHDLPNVGTMSEAFPHLIFHNFKTNLGLRVRLYIHSNNRLHNRAQSAA